MEVAFNGVKTIDEIGVFTVQDSFASLAEPDLTTAFTQYGVTDFEVQYWDGAAWQTVTGGNVTGNNKVWRKFTFSPVHAQKVRVLVHNALAGYSRLVEIEAWGGTACEENPKWNCLGCCMHKTIDSLNNIGAAMFPLYRAFPYVPWSS